MTQVLFASDTTPSLVDLDANFTEVYQVRSLANVSSGKLGWFATPSVQWQVTLASGAGSPWVGIDQAVDNPYIVLQRWSGSGSTYGGARFKGTGNGAVVLETAPDAAIGSQTFTEALRVDSSRNLIPTLQTSAPSLSSSGQMVFTLTSNTNLRISVRGSDGTTRTANITLA